MGTESLPGVKRPGRGLDHPPPSSTEVKERVERYIYSSSGPSWPALWWTLSLPLIIIIIIIIIEFQVCKYTKEQFGNFESSSNSTFIFSHQFALGNGKG
jgi:hypothetical protein